MLTCGFGVARQKGEWQELMWKEGSHGHVGTGSAPRAVVCTEEEGAQAWEAGNPGFSPSSSLTNLLKPQFPDALNGDNKASQGFLVGKGGIKEVTTHGSVFEESRVLRTKGTDVAHILPLLCPVLKADIADQCQHFLVKLY